MPPARMTPMMNTFETRTRKKNKQDAEDPAPGLYNYLFYSIKGAQTETPIETPTTTTESTINTKVLLFA